MYKSNIEILFETLIKDHDFVHIITPDFCVTENQKVLEKKLPMSNVIRVILDSQGETKECWIQVYGFDSHQNVWFDTRFGSGTPRDAIYSFFQTFNL